MRNRRSVLEGRGVDLFMVETFYDLDELETAIGAVRSVSTLPIVALLTFDAGGETLAGVKAEDAAARLRPLGLARVRREPRRRPGRRAQGTRADGRRRSRARGAPERRAREHERPADRLPTRDSRLFRRVRRAGARARRSGDRRLLRDDAGPDRGDPRGSGRRSPAHRLLPRPGAQAGGAVRAGHGRDPARSGSCARASSRSRCRSTRRSGPTRRR